MQCMGIGFWVGGKMVKEQDLLCIPVSLGSTAKIRNLYHDSGCHLS